MKYTGRCQNDFNVQGYSHRLRRDHARHVLHHSLLGVLRPRDLAPGRRLSVPPLHAQRRNSDSAAVRQTVRQTVRQCGIQCDRQCGMHRGCARLTASLMFVLTKAGQSAEAPMVGKAPLACSSETSFSVTARALCLLVEYAPSAPLETPAMLAVLTMCDSTPCWIACSLMYFPNSFEPYSTPPVARTDKSHS
jgi:hypothetical protein